MKSKQAPIATGAGSDFFQACTDVNRSWLRLAAICRRTRPRPVARPNRRDICRTAFILCRVFYHFCRQQTSAGNSPWNNPLAPYRANRNHTLLQENDLFHLLRIGKRCLIRPKTGFCILPFRKPPASIQIRFHDANLPSSLFWERITPNLSLSNFGLLRNISTLSLSFIRFVSTQIAAKCSAERTFVGTPS